MQPESNKDYPKKCNFTECEPGWLFYVRCAWEELCVNDQLHLSVLQVELAPAAASCLILPFYLKNNRWHSWNVANAHEITINLTFAAKLNHYINPPPFWQISILSPPHKEKHKHSLRVASFSRWRSAKVDFASSNSCRRHSRTGFFHRQDLLIFSRDNT